MRKLGVLMLMVLSSLPAAAETAVKLSYCNAHKTDAKAGDYCDPKAPNAKKAFKPRGTERNVRIQASFAPVATPRAFLFKLTDADGGYVEDKPIGANAKVPRAMAAFTINKPGTYKVAVVDYKNQDTVLASDTFTVEADDVGPRATGNQAAGRAKLTVCKEVNDAWQPVGAATTWPAGKTFNVLLVNEVPFQTDFVGFIVHKQGDDGRDSEFVNEWQQTVGEKDRKYATTEGLTSLPAGRYSLYAIDWRKREVSEHQGNLTEYFAKVTLTVK